MIAVSVVLAFLFMAALLDDTVHNTYREVSLFFVAISMLTMVLTHYENLLLIALRLPFRPITHIDFLWLITVAGYGSGTLNYTIEELKTMIKEKMNN